MTDIVERLRSYASDDHERLCQGREYSCTCGYDEKRDPLLAEAAAKIERLRAALEDVLSHTSYGDIPVTIYDNARAALAEEKKDDR
jgi:hypothetical protein